MSTKVKQTSKLCQTSWKIIHLVFASSRQKKSLLASTYAIKLEASRNNAAAVTAAIDRVIPVVDINALEPWNLPTLAGELCRGDTEQWFFFSPGQEREARGGRPSRTTASGYWKATGSPGYVYSSDNRVIGVKKSMVFYKGKAPMGRKTKWKMNEYRAISNPVTPQLRCEFSLYRVYIVSGSFRAFDRRPSETEGAESRLHQSSSQVSHLLQLSQLSELSQLPEAGDSSSRNWNEEQLQEPSWELEWEHFNWV